VIVAATASATQAAVKASPATPIVQASGTSPVDRGLAKSLPRPGGTVTGLTNLSNDVAEKYLELLLDAVSGIRRVGFLIDTSIPALRDAAMKAARRSADQFRIDGRFGEIAQPAEIERAITDLAKDGAQALIPMPGLFLTAHSHRIVTTAQAHRLPVVGGVGFLQAGALVTYGAQSAALYRRAAYFVDRILKGAKPADLPIEQPATFELVVNVKTARSLGLALPRELLVRADRIIE
jgi:putative ABC transport system substrate-binding protein